MKRSSLVPSEYREIVGAERDALILDILKRIDEDTQVIGAESRKQEWQDGWADASVDSLVPKFIKRDTPLRYNGSFIHARDPWAELRFIDRLREEVLQDYFSFAQNIYEFGCGTGWNLVAFSSMFPKKNLFASDFVNSSLELVSAVTEKYDLSITVRHFDMMMPDPSYKIQPNSAIFTFGAIEQLASNFQPFLDYLLRQKPGLCLHIEPTIELYDENNLLDYLAIKFHKKRGYTVGFLPALRDLAHSGRIHLIEVKRMYFGSTMHEGYSLIVWRPL